MFPKVGILRLLPLHFTASAFGMPVNPPFCRKWK
jgi:hypothetical protein